MVGSGPPLVNVTTGCIYRIRFLIAATRGAIWGCTPGLVRHHDMDYAGWGTATFIRWRWRDLSSPLGGAGACWCEEVPTGTGGTSVKEGKGLFPRE